MSECFNFTLILYTELIVLDQGCNLKFFDSNVRQLVLGLVNYGSRTFSDPREVTDSGHINFEEFSSPQSEVQELNCKILLLVIGIRSEAKPL